MLATSRKEAELLEVGKRNHESGDLRGAADAANPSEAECHNALAMVFFGLGQTADAEQSLRDAITLTSKPHFHLSLAGMRERLRASAACDTAGFARQMESLYSECVSR